MKSIEHVNNLKTGFNAEKREIYIVGEIEEGLMVRFISALKTLEETTGPIKIILSSPGGEEVVGYAMYDFLMTCRNKIIIEAYGQASSIAAAILQAGDMRMVSPNCEILIHNGTVPTDEQMQQDAVIDMADKIKKDNEKYYSILTNKSRLTLKQVKNFCKDEKTFSAKEAIKYGLADRLINYKKKGKLK